MRGSDQIYMFMYSILKMPLISQNWGFEHLFSALTRGRRRGRNRAMVIHFRPTQAPVTACGLVAQLCAWDGRDVNCPDCQQTAPWRLYMGIPEKLVRGELLNSTPGALGREKSWGVGGAVGGAVMEPAAAPRPFSPSPSWPGIPYYPPPHNCILSTTYLIA